MQSPATLEPLAAIHKLKQYRKILSPDDAIAYLKEQQISYSLELIYRHFFPIEFANSTAASYLPYPKPKRGNSYAPKEIELLDLIDDKLFPVNDWICTNLIEERLYYIPITSNGINWETEDFDLSYIRKGWQALILLSSYYRWWLDLSQYEKVDDDDEIGWDESILKIRLEKIADPDLIDPELLEKLCVKAESPINFLPLAVQLMEHNTGNIWLDSYSQEEFSEAVEEGDVNLTWTIENIKYLTNQHQGSEIIWNKIDLLINWLESDLTRNFKKVIKIWNLSSRQK